MQDIVLRPAAPADATAIYRLNCDEMGYDYPLAETEGRLRLLLNDPAHRILVAEAHTQVAGYIHAHSYDVLYAGHIKNILALAVDGRHKRQGIGRMLLSSVEAWAKAEGAEGVRLVSGSTRTGAHRFYLACGYNQNKEQLNFSKIFFAGS